MSRSAQPFTQGDITRAVKGAVKAGLNVQRFEVDRDGKIVVFAGQPEAHGTIEKQANEWDGVK
jgi:hypothetical protein